MLKSRDRIISLEIQSSDGLNLSRPIETSIIDSNEQRFAFPERLNRGVYILKIATTSGEISYKKLLVH